MPATHRPAIEATHLRRRLVTLDAIALVFAWLPAQLWKHPEGVEPWKSLVVGTVLLVSGLLLLRVQGLYLARVASSRGEEIRRLVLSSIMLGLLYAVLLSVMGLDVDSRWLWISPVLLLLLLVWFRGGFRAWLSATRASGQNLRDVLVVGANGDAAELVAMLREHPEAGFRVCGVIGDPTVAAINGLSSLHRGGFDELRSVVRVHGICGVIVVLGAMPTPELASVMSELENEGIHIQVSNGLHGLSHRRLRATPVAYQSLYYVEPADTATPQLVLKRAIDVTLALIGLIVFAPVIVLVALAVKASDRGPVLFRQCRVGRNGTLFYMLKFRTMVVDAEAQLNDLAESNERHGPLFKLEHDPRVTRLGRFLRSSSLDELPQLVNVLRGEMSVVGPRPALPSEVAQFDDRLLDRLQMPPGITGLWQVEARDNPHFGAYRRLDLFYVDNWSINLDLVIIVATVEQVLAKAVRALAPNRRQSAPVVPLRGSTAQPPSGDEVQRSA